MGTARSWITGPMPGGTADVVATRPPRGVTGRPDARFRDDDLASQGSSSPGRGEIVPLPTRTPSSPAATSNHDIHLDSTSGRS
jgi:hypothetical protein